MLNMYVQSLSRTRLYVTPWTTAWRVPLFMGFLRQEYWSELPFLSPVDLPDPSLTTSAICMLNSGLSYLLFLMVFNVCGKS